MSERSLGIEITPSQIKVVEIDASKTPPKVYNFSSFDILSADPENISRQMLSGISHLKIKTKKARIAVEGDKTHQIISLPPLPTKEMKVVATREVKEAIGHQTEEVISGWRIIGSDEEGKKVVLLTAVSSNLLKEKALLLQNAGLSPNLITTIPLALFNLSKLIQGVDLGACCFAHLGETVAHAIFIREGKWAFYRKLSISGEGHKAFLSEMNRSLLYYRHQFRGEEVARIFLSGEITEGLEKTCSKILGRKVERVFPNLDLSPLKGKADEFRRFLPEFAISIGLAGKRAKDSINLRHPDMLTGIREAIIKKTAIMGLIISVLVMGVGYGYLSRTVSQYKKNLSDKGQALIELKPYLAAREARMLFGNNLALLKDIDGHTHWAEALRELSIIVPPQMAFQSLRFKREKGKIILTINGEILAPRELEGREIFNRFYSRWGSSPLFTNLAVEPTGIKVIRPKQNSPIQLEFEVQGELAAVEIEYETD